LSTRRCGRRLRLSRISGCYLRSDPRRVRTLCRLGWWSFPGRRVRRESGERNPFTDALAGETQTLRSYQTGAPSLSRGAGDRHQSWCAPGRHKSWIHALSRQELIDAVHDNLRNLGLDKLDVVNLRVGEALKPSEGSI